MAIDPVGGIGVVHIPALVLDAFLLGLSVSVVRLVCDADRDDFPGLAQDTHFSAAAIHFLIFDFPITHRQHLKFSPTNLGQ